MRNVTEDALLLKFASEWEPYGGAEASEIFTQFGIGRGEFRARLHRILTVAVAADMDRGLYRRLLRYTTESNSV